MKMPFFPHTQQQCVLLAERFATNNMTSPCGDSISSLFQVMTIFSLFGALVWDHEKLETEIDSAPEQQPPCFDK